MSNNESCFVNTLRLINNLQRNNEEELICDNTCSRPFLGNISGFPCLNTRPVTFYNCDNCLLEVEYLDSCGNTRVSSVFRVKSVGDNCVTCTILAENPTPTVESPYITTNQTVIINLNCVCCLKCLSDTFVCL